MSKTENQNVPTVAEFRKAGWKVRVQHVRNMQIVNRGGEIIIQPVPRGGETYVSLVPPKNFLLGKAKCSEKDSYNKKEGVKLATQRALENYEGEIAL